eukprot:462962-Pelagomonas_calceolata.AAC.1
MRLQVTLDKRATGAVMGLQALQGRACKGGREQGREGQGMTAFINVLKVVIHGARHEQQLLWQDSHKVA